ncbi:MAG TPA: hypothetical protein VF762_11825, partial [Blastocatellia bacterium]
MRRQAFFSIRPARILCWVFVITLCLSTGRAMSQEISGGANGSLRTVSDMVAVTAATGTTIYLVDGETGSIYYHLRPAGTETTPLDFRSFKPFLSAQEFHNLRGIAYSAGKLYVCDHLIAGLFEVDIETKTIKTLLKGPPLQKPLSV